MTGRLKVGVVGASGFLGGELVRLLSGHPRVELVVASAGRSAGQRLADVRPSLAALGDLELVAADPELLASRCEAVFLALPHGESAIAAPALLERGLRVVDLSSDFRLRRPEEHERWYGKPHPAPLLLEAAFYSLPELTGPPPASARLVASPGCFATALALGTLPLVPHLAPGARVVASGITGSSGSGVTPTERVHHALRSTDFAAYRPLAHQHLGELSQLMQARAGRAVPVDFVAHSAPLVRGIHLTLALRLPELTADPLAALREAYSGSRLVRVREGEVRLGSVIGSCRVEIGVVSDAEAALVFVALDNLLKGGAGQAVQSLNLWLGWEETDGLPLLAAWP